MLRRSPHVCVCVCVPQLVPKCCENQMCVHQIDTTPRAQNVMLEIGAKRREKYLCIENQREALREIFAFLELARSAATKYLRTSNWREALRKEYLCASKCRCVPQIGFGNTIVQLSLFYFNGRRRQDPKVSETER